MNEEIKILVVFPNARMHTRIYAHTSLPLVQVTEFAAAAPSLYTRVSVPKRKQINRKYLIATIITCRLEWLFKD